MLNADKIISVIERKARQTLSRVLTAEEYEFVLYKAPLLSRKKSGTDLNISVDGRIAEAIDRSGWGLVVHTLFGLDNDLIRRALTKLSPGGPWGDNQTLIRQDDLNRQDAAQAYQLAVKVCREVIPEWSRLLN